MNKIIFEDLGMSGPDINLGIGSGSHAEQTAKVMVAFEKVCLEQKPDLVIVVGDVNSTLACAITAKKLGIKVAHVEAGLRSRDMNMPEEINRVCTDVLSDFLFTSDRLSVEILKSEGVSGERILFVGNVMVDTLLKYKPMASKLDLVNRLGLKTGIFATLTLHRPSNVDDKNNFQGILEALTEISAEMPILFPIHPRTRKMIDKFGFERYLNRGDRVVGIRPLEPLGYLEFLHLNMNARMVFTDSGGVQAETTVLGVPCITMRHNTEHPITCEDGTNILAGNRKDDILAAARHVLTGPVMKGKIPEKWDGKSADRIVEFLLKV
jgi:UDP-N-acetylglucosamine 2-epimerase (non-hydrolysing)